MLIPKRFIYFWFGPNKLPELSVKCLRSWGKFHPDFEFILITDKDVNLNDPIQQQLYLSGQYAFLSDYLRFKYLYEIGGVYLDVDIELVKPIDHLMLGNQTIFGYESVGRPNGAVILSPKGDSFTKKALQLIIERHESSKPYLIIPELLEFLMSDSSIDFTCLPQDVFYPYNPYDENNPVKQLMFQDITEQTVAVHHYNKQWKLSFLVRLKRYIEKKF